MSSIKKINNKNLKYIKDFASIKISKICRELNIDCSNLYNGKVSDDKILKVKNEIEKKLFELIKEDSKN